MEKKIRVYSGASRLPKGRASSLILPGCLVIEGGAFRGLYNQGVLDAMMQNDMNFQTVIGVSAGALAGMNYVAGQIGRSARANLCYRHDSRYFGRKALLESGSILNIGFLFQEFDQTEPLDMERLNSPDRHFVAVATNCTNGKPAYFDRENCSDIRKAVRASASMPYMTPMVDVDGTPCLDGGCCSSKIPYEWALEQDFTKIVIIRTRERSFRKNKKESKAALAFYRKYPAFAKALAGSNIAYDHACDEIDELEKAGRVYVIAPKDPVHVGRVEGDMEKLGELYWQGYHDMTDQLDRLKAYLAK